MKNFEKKIQFNISRNQNVIEYLLTAINYLKSISNIIKKNTWWIVNYRLWIQ